ncbi:hypothetical protein LSM04_006538 [Trypanosoma melophagium]|uniref:uncharacterized protein n=1 Tax=Trypanosoma melophagium TaxID=715481 RepID=UPI00351A2E3B|nr:hypothetical protein LSM04_006538 [Trypanosoma melophagium]
MTENGQIVCHAVVNRMGEIFGEFSFEFDHRYFADNVSNVTKWNLHIDEEDMSGETTELVDDEIPISKGHKVIKLHPGKYYLVRVRVYSENVSLWGPWSETVRTSSLQSVRTQIKEIGEYYVRVQWDRPPRETLNIVAEKDSESTQEVANISQFELRLLREKDMVQEFQDAFATGVRTYTVHGLLPGTAYIVMTRYKTLINTMNNWKEIGRFYTRPANIISLLTRGENAITVGWILGPSPVDAVGYVVPDTAAHRYEVSIEAEDVTIDPVELPEYQHSYRIDGLTPGTMYSFYVRSLTIEGRWGNRSGPFRVRTACVPELSVVASGETFLSFTWMRERDETNESKVEFCLKNTSSAYKQEDIVEIGPREEDKVIHLQGLTAGTEYSMSIRVFLQEEWGLWTEPRFFRTQSKVSLTFLERGEDFFTLAFETSATERGSVRFNVVVMEVGKNGERVAVLDDEIVRGPDDPGFRVDFLQADTVYEVKCRAWQYNRVAGFEGWGEFTTPVQTRTLQHLVLHVWDIGEDFAQLQWRRGLSEATLLTADQKQQDKQQQQQQWPDLKYEVVVGCLDTGEDEIIHQRVLQTNFTITNLRPATTYVVSVRACNELDQWGLWSKVTLRTLASIVTSIHEIGEDFARLMWQRQNIDEVGTLKSSNGSSGSTVVDSSLTTADMFVSKYAVFVFSREDGESTPSCLSGYHMGGNADVARYETVSSEHTSLRVNELLPDREYIAVVRASTATGKWGLWSRPIRFRSNPQFRIPVNNLTIGENYVNLVWSRDAHPMIDKDVFVGDLAVTGQQLRIHGVDTPYSKDHTLPADMRELKIYGLSPATAYTIQIRVCGKSGNWGRWSTPVHILTRDTIVTKSVEVAEDYAIIAWERRKVINPKNYPTGRGVVTSYHLRVYNASGVHSEVFLGDGDSPYRIGNLSPDTYYCVEMKANYNDEEWGLWSTPLWYLTMKSLEIQTKLISEEFCCIVIKRPYQQKRLPEDDGNRTSDDRNIAFGQFRSNLMLCVTSPILTSSPHATTGYTRLKNQNSSLPPNAVDHRLIYQTEILCTTDDTEHTIPNLRSNTVYAASVRSKLENGEWSMWSLPSLLFATVPATQVEFTDIGEKFVTLEWKRSPQRIPSQIKDPSEVKCGLGSISASRLKVREIGGTFQKMYELNNSLTTMRLEHLSPATTYAVSVQTYNDNYEWGVWSEEGKVRTSPGMDIAVQHISEDAVWVAWSRKSDVEEGINFDTALNLDVVPRAYEISIIGSGNFIFTKEMDSNTLFFRGLQPDTVYSFQVRAQSTENQEWGLWASQPFRTKPRHRVTFGNVGEHFVVVEWRRHLPALLDERDANTIIESEDVVQQFRLKVQRVGDKVPYIYDLSPYISNFRLKDLQPSAEYRVWLCAKGYEGVWGFWNDEERVRTLPKLELDVTDIGEDYVAVSWKRGKWMGETATDSGSTVREVDGAVSGYRVRVLDAKGVEVVSRSISFHDTSCTLSPLKLCSVYSVEVSAKDTYNEWGLWSDAKRFVTLEAVNLRLLRVGETFAEVEWGRRSDLAQRRRQRRARDAAKLAAEGGDKMNHSGKSVDGSTSSEYDYDEEKEDEEEQHVDGRLKEMEENGRTGMLDDTKQYETKHPGYPTFLDSMENSEESEDEDDYCDYTIEEDQTLLRGDGAVLQWHLRVEGQRVFGGQPGVNDSAEFYADADALQHIIDSLLPYAVYTVSVQAQDKRGMWGHWSSPRQLITYPLLKLTADNITETFIHVIWSRPPVTMRTSEGFICFPPETHIHNYQVHIEPLSTEEPFDERDEPLVNGARVYETSQPSLRLSNLTPGVRYRVLVREQLINANGGFVPDNWGSFSDVQVVEMVRPMGVTPVEIGEDYCLVGWHRIQREAGEVPDISVVTGVGKVTGYELRAVRLDNRAREQYRGPLALDTIVSLEPSATSYHLGNLVSNTIYAVCVRAQTEGHWGPWSAVMKFVSQSRLEVKVHAVFEDTVLLSWSRPLPVWAMGRSHATSPSSFCIVSDDQDATTTIDPQTMINSSENITNDNTTTTTTNNNNNTITNTITDAGNVDVDENGTPEDMHEDLDAVLLGDYSVDRYELYLEGITCNMRRCLTLSKEQLSVRITGLLHNHIYSVCVRSQSEKLHWSMLSRRESVLTLSPMCVEVSHYTENLAVIRWYRAAQNVLEYESLLHDLRVEVERQCDERERHDLFELKRRVQEMEASQERENLSDYLAVRREHNVAVRMDAVHHLKVENIILADAEVSGYHLKFYGEDCLPVIDGLNRMLLQDPAQPLKSATRKRKQDSGRKNNTYPNTNRQQQQRRRQQQEAGINIGDINASNTVAITTEKESGLIGGGGKDESLLKEETPLLTDVQLSSSVTEVLMKGLEPSKTFSIELRARNSMNDWCPWSQRECFRTINSVELHQKRFGEHYINLYWHRLPESLTQTIETHHKRLQELNSEFNSMSAKDLEDKKRELSEEEYNVLVERLKNWRDLKREVSELQERLASGHGGVVVHDKTPVKGYQLRIIHENGSFIDQYIENNNYENSKSEIIKGSENYRSKTNYDTDTVPCAFTVTGLTSNTMYSALLCIDYGLGWGPWTNPLKFMTQNLIQLLITYISEAFVDIEWHRAPNKALNPLDEGSTLTSDATSIEGCIFQVRITHEDDESGETIEEFRTMRSCSIFRIDNLLTDTKYTFAVREWDAEGDWGLWSTPKTCVTLPGMTASVEALGEDWADVSWSRKERRVDYDDDLHVLQYGVEEVSYYLMVQELADDGRETAEEEEEEKEKEREGVWFPLETTDINSNKSPKTVVDEMEGIFTAERQSHGPLPPQEHPLEFEGDRDGRYYLTRRFGKNISTFKLENLRPDKFYSLQVLSETTGGQLGVWSRQEYLLTMSKINLTTQFIDEQYVDLTWKRMPPRQHPRLPMNRVFTGQYTTKAYILEVNGKSGFHVFERLEEENNTTYHLSGLSLSSFYKARVRSISDEDLPSLWSDTLRFVTLNPISVQPSQITEHSIVLEWGREEQRPINEETNGEYDPTICVGSRKCSGYLVRVSMAGEQARGFILEKSFPGDVLTFNLTSLTPNTLYIVSVRGLNNTGEWGMWSEERCIYTMKLISLEVATVGEDFIRVLWTREAPDELQLPISPTATPRYSNRNEDELTCEDVIHMEESNTHGINNSYTLANSDHQPMTIITTETVTPVMPISRTLSTATANSLPITSSPPQHASTLIPMIVTGQAASVSIIEVTGPQRRARSTSRMRYPLLDRPEVRSSMYNSTKTHVISYAVSVLRIGEGEGYTIEVPGDTTVFTIPSLIPDVRYSLSVCACYGNGEWGPNSVCVVSGTMNLLAVELRGLGEDYLTAAWQRLPNTYDVSSVNFGRVEETISYQVAVHDFTDVPFGEEDVENLPPRLQRTLCVPAQVNSCTVKELLSHHRYRVSVRRWYKPLESFLTVGRPLTVETPPHCDDEQLSELLQRSSAACGAWSDGIYDVTLQDMVCMMDETAEDFFVLRWERDPRVPPLPVRNPFPVKPVEGYHLRIDEMTPDGTAVDTSSTSVHIDQPLRADEVTFTAQNMRPDTVYRVDVRCCVDNVWGRWSRTIYVLTLPRLVIEIHTIGEDYASFSWQRPRRSLILPDGTEALCGNDDEVDKFHLEVVGLQYSFHVSKKFKATRNTYRVKQLEPNTVYSVCVRASDTRRNGWGLWSDRVLFATLKPMHLIVGPAAEQFATVEWYREAQTAEEYKDIIGEGIAFSPTAGNPSAPLPICTSDTDTDAVSGVPSPSSSPPPPPTTTTTGSGSGSVVCAVQIGNPDVIAYHLCVFNSQHTPALAVVDKQFPKDVTKYSLGGLEADTPYVVILRACNTESRWGLWSKEGVFRTQRLLELHVKTVGEIYANLEWEREKGDHADDGRVSGTKAEPIMYQLLLKAGAETIERLVQPNECNCTSDDFKRTTYLLEGLKPNTSYLMALQPGYEENRWGLWTASIDFKTIPPINITINSIGADRLELSFIRTPAAAPISSESPPVEEGKAEMEGGNVEHVNKTSTVLRYQLVVRKTEEILVNFDKERESDVVVPTAGNSCSAVPSAAYTDTTPDALADGDNAESGGDVFIATDNAIDHTSNSAGVGENISHIAETTLYATTNEAVNITGDNNNVAANNSVTAVDAENSTRNEVDIENVWRNSIPQLFPRREPFVLEREIEVDKEAEDPTTLCELDGLDNCTCYTIQVRAMDNNEMWGAWEEVIVETAPLPPQSVTLRRVNAQFCLLQWEAPDNRYLYRYVVEQVNYIPTDSRGGGKSKTTMDWRVVDTVEDTSCRVRCTAPGGKLRFRVKATRAGGDGLVFSEYCDPVRLTSGTPPEPVQQLRVSTLSSSGFTVEWTPSRSEPTRGASRAAAAIAYRIYLAAGDRAPILAAAVRGTSHTLADLEPATTYTVQVVAEGPDGISYGNPMLRVVTRPAGDNVVLHHVDGQPPLAFPVEPLASTRRAVLPEIPSGRPTLVPQPPTVGKRQSRGRSVATSHSATVPAIPTATANAASYEGSVSFPRTNSGPPTRSSSFKQKKNDRLPLLKKKR